MLLTGTSLTVTSQNAVFPLLDLTLIRALPAPTAVTLPEELTLATLVLLEDHFRVLLDAFEGEIVAFSVNDSHLFKVFLAALSLTLFTAMILLTVTLQVFFLPFGVLTVIVQDPLLTPVTLPDALTVAIFLLLEVQTKSLLSTLDGVTVVVRVADLPERSCILVLFSLMVLTGIMTWILHFCVFPSPDFATIVQLPFPTAVTLPYLLTVATLGLVVAHAMDVV